MIRTFIQIASLVLTLEAALFLAKAGLGLSAAAIVELASTKWDFNADLVASLSQQQADTWVGVVLLLIAFALQMTNAMWPLRYADFAVHRGAATYAIILCLTIGFGAFYVSKELALQTAADVRATLDQEMRDREQASPSKQ